MFLTPRRWQGASNRRVSVETRTGLNAPLRARANGHDRQKGTPPASANGVKNPRPSNGVSARVTTGCCTLSSYSATARPVQLIVIPMVSTGSTMYRVRQVSREVCARTLRALQGGFCGSSPAQESRTAVRANGT